MSDLREAIERIESDFRLLGEEPDKFTATTLAAARRFLALTEEGYEVDCRRSFVVFDDDTGTNVHFDAGRYLIIHADYLTEEET